MIDLERVRAIDVHVHAEVARDGHDPMPPELREAAQRYFRGEAGTPTVDDVAAYYRERQMACVVFTVDYESRSGRAPVANEEIAEAAAANADVLIPFASIDPARSDAAERARATDRRPRRQGLQVPPEPPGVLPRTTGWRTRSTR